MSKTVALRLQIRLTVFLSIATPTYCNYRFGQFPRFENLPGNQSQSSRNLQRLGCRGLPKSTCRKLVMRKVIMGLEARDSVYLEFRSSKHGLEPKMMRIQVILNGRHAIGSSPPLSPKSKRAKISVTDEARTRWQRLISLPQKQILSSHSVANASAGAGDDQTMTGGEGTYCFSPTMSVF